MPAAAVAEHWWLGFEDAQLDRLIEQALSDNPGLAQAVARLRLAEAQAAQRRTRLSCPQ